MYTNPGGTECHYTRILIEDEGPGLDPEECRHIFDRFYKGKARTGTAREWGWRWQNH